MSFETLKATINSNIVSGLADGIRADYEHNPTLQDIVSAFGQDYIYMGSATVGTSPMTDDNARMYISSGSGDFTAFRDSGNNAIDISEGEIAILKGISGVYEKDVFFSGDTIDAAGSVRINDTGSLIQLQVKYNGSWITVSEFSYIGGDITLQDVETTNINANSIVINGDVESGYNTEVKDYLCINGDVLVSQNEYLYADDFVEDRLESTTGEYIPNTASNSLAEIGMDTINDKCVLYNEAITSKDGVIESIIPSSTDGDFSVTRSSITNRVNRDGFIEQVPVNTASYNYDSGDTHPYLLTEAASTNLITYPKSFGDVYWTKSGATIEGDSTLTLTGTDVASGWDFTSGWTASGTATIDSATSFTLNAASDYVNKKYNTLTGDAVLVRIVGTKDSGTLYIKDKDGTGGSTYTITDNSFDVTFWMNYASSQEPIMFTTGGGGAGQVNITTMEFYEAQGFEAPKEIPVANGEELVTNGDMESGGVVNVSLPDNWSLYNTPTSAYKSTGKVYNGTYSIYVDGVNDSGVLTDAISWVEGKTYLIEAYVWLVDEEVRMLRTNPSIIDFEVASTTTGQWTKLSTYATAASSGSASVRFMATGTAPTFYIDNVSVKEVTSYSGGGFEREAYKLVEDTSNGSHTVRKTSGLTITSGVDVTFSVYAKKGERNWIAFSNDYGSGLSGWFDLENGVWGQVNVATVSSEELANGWYRLSLTATSSSTSAEVRIYSTTSDGNYSYQGDGTSGIYIAYAQFEESGYASSLMLPASEGSTATRVGDVVENAGNSALFSDVNNSGVLYTEIAANSDDGTGRWITICDGTYSNFASIYYHSTSNQVVGRLSVSGGQAEITYTLTDSTEFSKVAFRYAVNDFSLWVDGVERGTDTSGITFSASTLNEVTLSDAGGADNFYGKTNTIAVFDYLSDYEMIRLTK